MKIIRRTLTLSVFLITAQFGKADIFDDVIKAFESGEAEKVISYFSDRTEMQMPDGLSGNKTKAQALDILRQFMKANPVKSMTIQHRGPAGASSFVIAHYQSQNGKTFRVTIYISSEGNKKSIQELTFENS